MIVDLVETIVYARSIAILRIAVRIHYRLSKIKKWGYINQQIKTMKNNALHKNTLLFSVLVVDDDEKVLTSIDLLLRRIGLNNVSLCSDSRNVEAILEKNGFSIILLDLDLPYITGEELLRKIHA